MPKISIINESSVIADAAVKSYVPAFTQQWNEHLQKVWSVEAAQFELCAKGTRPSAGSWWLVFLDNSDQADALAYHDLTNDGMPISKVFVKTLQGDKASISVGATHELCEMAVDPWLNSAYQDSRGIFWAGEICDPVEDDKYGYTIQGVLVTDFVTPDWFGHRFSLGPMDFQKHAKAQFEILSGGYAQVYDPQKGWQQINGSKAVADKRHAAVPAPGSRRERRSRGWQQWIRSEASWTKSANGKRSKR